MDCPSCSRGVLLHLNQHLKDYNDNEYVYECDRCSLLFTREQVQQNEEGTRVLMEDAKRIANDILNTPL